MNMMFHPEVLKTLHDAGWHVGRHYNIDSIVKCLSEEGYNPKGCIIDFLSEFGDLIITFPSINVVTRRKLDNISNNINIKAIDAAMNIYRDDVSLYEERCGETLVPIGRAYENNFTLLMSHSGKIYGGYVQHLYLYGENKYEAFHNIIELKHIREVE